MAKNKQYQVDEKVIRFVDAMLMHDFADMAYMVKYLQSDGLKIDNHIHAYMSLGAYMFARRGFVYSKDLVEQYECDALMDIAGLPPVERYAAYKGIEPMDAARQLLKAICDLRDGDMGMKENAA